MKSLKSRLNNYFEKAVNTETKWFNWKLGLMGGIPSGVINYFFNNSGSVEEGLYAAATQACYVFFVGSATSKVCENIATNIKNKRMAVISSSLVPTSIALLAGYAWHDLVETANPLISATWPQAINLFSFGGFGYYWHKRGKQEEPITSSTINQEH